MRASSLNLIRQATREEIGEAVGRFSEVFGKHAEEMAREQMAWFEALGRPLWDEDKVRKGLLTTLERRELKWGLKVFPDVRAALDAWNSWAIWATWAAWNAWATRDTWNTVAAAARAARDALDSWAIWGAWTTKTTWNARWYALDPWDAWDARDALTLHFADLNGWVKHPKNLLDGLREAYQFGLEVAIPTGPDEFGYAMAC